MYHIDVQDGLVPEDIPLDRYLGVFLSPGTVPNWNWGVTIGAGVRLCGEQLPGGGQERPDPEGASALWGGASVHRARGLGPRVVGEFGGRTTCMCSTG